MSNLHIYNLFSENNFPIRDKYISFKGSFNKNVKSKISFLNNHFNILLKKNKKEQEIFDTIQQYNLLIKSIEEKKEKKIRSDINKKLRMLFNHQKLKSVSNNKMLLDLMANNTKFINYLNTQKIQRKINSANLKIKKNCSSPFITEIRNINNKENNTTNLNKQQSINLTNTIDYKQKRENKNKRKDLFSSRLKKAFLKKELSDGNINSMSLKNSYHNSNLLNSYFHKRENFILTPKIKRNKNNLFSLRKNVKSKFNKTNDNKLILKYISSKIKTSSTNKNINNY